MPGGFKLGAPFGIGLYVHWSFGLLLLFFLFAGGGVGSVLFLLALFACVTLHEYGHALTARAFGIPTLSITLYPVGGVARLASMTRNPKEELLIALAGPAVNVAIAILLLPAVAAGGLSAMAAPEAVVLNNGTSFLLKLLLANVALVVFNLLPAFPMDGGRVLRALLAFGGDYAKATHIAARVGQVFAVLFVVAGLFFMNSLILPLIGVVIFMAATGERRAVLHSLRQGPPPIPTGDGNWEVLPPAERSAGSSPR